MWKFIWGVNIIFTLIYQVAIYAGCAYSLYVIAKRNGVKVPVLAFVPFLQFYVVGSICEEYEIKGYRIKQLGLVMVLLSVIQAAGSISAAGGIFSLAAGIFMALVFHKFYYLFSPQNAFIFALLSMFELPRVIILFMIKDKPMLMSAAAYHYPFGN